MFTKQNSVALWQRSFIVVVVFLALIYCSDITKVFAGRASGGGLAKELFTVASYDEYLHDRLEKEKQDPTIVRDRYVQVKFDYLVGKDIPYGAEAIKLNLFYDVSHTVVKERVEKRSETQYTWFGHIKDVKHSQVILVVENGSMAGNITVDGNMYQIRRIGDGVHIICEIDQSAFPEDAPPIQTPDTPDIVPPTSQTDDGSTIDIMVVYTGDVASASGDIVAEIQLAIDTSNQSYANSGINQRLRLVHSQEVVYDETGTTSTDLDCLTSPSDSCLDQIHTWRDTYGADLVCLWVENGGASCGVAWVTASASYAFSVVDRGCATGNLSFPHELGHNMGSAHDRANSGSPGAYDYSYGYQDPGGDWRTIMAYSTGCSGACTRLPYWSNPDIMRGGVPMGVPEGQPDAADNRKTLNNTALTIANFRTSTISFASPDIKANGADGPVNINKGDPLSIAISLSSSSSGGSLADWWIIVSTPSGWQYYDFSLGDYTPGLVPSLQGVSLVDFGSSEIFNTSGLGAGTYTYYFAVDVGGQWFLDSVVVTVTAIDPSPQITANGSGGTVNINEGAPLAIAISLSSGSFSGESADWWIIVSTSSGWEYYDFSLGDYTPGLMPSLQGVSLVDFGSNVISNPSGLGAGTSYTYYFAVDLGGGQLFFDSVVVNITTP